VPPSPTRTTAPTMMRSITATARRPRAGCTKRCEPAGSAPHDIAAILAVGACGICLSARTCLSICTRTAICLAAATILLLLVASPARPEDTITIQNNIGNDRAVVLIDARSQQFAILPKIRHVAIANQGSFVVPMAYCLNDDIEIAQSSNRVDLGNLLENGSCNSEIAVLSDDNAMVFVPLVTAWSNLFADNLQVPLQPILNVPVAVWVAVPPTAPGLPNPSLARAQNDIANANLVFNDNNIGISFTPTLANVSGNQAALNTIGMGCANVNTVIASQWFVANRLNVYYVNSAFTGVNCVANRNIVYVGTIGNLATLAHEFGHAYSLWVAQGGHTNSVRGFNARNVMWAGGLGTRDHFSIGQAFRINTDTTSVLNTNGERSGSTRRCPGLQATNLCPALSLDSEFR
jgi:hypothetical protein